MPFCIKIIIFFESPVFSTSAESGKPIVVIEKMINYDWGDMTLNSQMICSLMNPCMIRDNARDDVPD